MANYTTPGVYVEEISTLPPSVADVSTAVPVFIGYTEKSDDLQFTPVKISTMLEFEQIFGKAFAKQFEVSVTTVNGVDSFSIQNTADDKFFLYYSLKIYFDNGGGGCYIISTGDFTATPSAGDFEKALESLKKEDEPTLIVLTDAVSLAKAEYYNLCKEALDQCATLGDRFLIADVIEEDGLSQDTKDLRDNIGTNDLKYGAAYAPYLNTLIPYQYTEDSVSIIAGSKSAKSFVQNNAVEVAYTGTDTGIPTIKIVKGSLADPEFKIEGVAIEIRNVKGMKGKDVVDKWKDWSSKNTTTGFDIKVNGAGDQELDSVGSSILTGSDVGVSLSSKKDTNTSLYNKIKTELAKRKITLPPSGAIAGIYAKTDRERGVWKAPANLSLNSVLGPTFKINDDEQSGLNVDPDAGKSINVIRSFTGKGTLVWGARTLAGNDNEWRYISVRRLFNLIEESTKKATAFAVFEGNDATTWLKVKAMIDSYLYGLWQQGALAGSSAEAAYYVNIGLGKTMTAQDVLEGRLIVEIGIAAVRPAEFIVIKFMHKLQEA